ncbi:myelin and lymphocyte protein [Spea bombifrons]|uniref:myelin and lymphocyte protein n=1 Tax=Spea bombifrons TaxID=233779 RepID=UPI002348FBFD|nr:myelin and lymphocyte protein [Spea bombifrons]
MMATTTAPPSYGDTSPLPAGIRTISTFPDLLMIFEFVFGGLVWILIAATTLPNTGEPQGWVMFVSIACFLFTFILMILYCIGAHGGSSSWTSMDAFYHCIAALLYLSASVIQSYFTKLLVVVGGRIYQLNIAAVVFAYLATLSYVIHAAFSLKRWKRSG